jgi:hypothetical protein
MGKMYCPQCGWNRGEAEKQTRLLLRLLPVLVILFDAPLIIWIFIGHAEIPTLAVLGVIAIVPAILVVLVVRGKVRIGSAGSPQPVTLQSGPSLITAPTEEVAEQYHVLAELPRPRPVRMSRLGKTNVAVIALALLMFAGVLVVTTVFIKPAGAGGNIKPPNRIVFVLPAVILGLVVYAMQRSLMQQRQLLSLGELAMARVTRQWIARNGYGIRYEYTTRRGETLSRMGTDSTRQAVVGMTIPVFYDARQPKKQVALCAAFYEIVLPGQG